jgi:CRISPR system Cascade subunit CasE
MFHLTKILLSRAEMITLKLVDNYSWHKRLWTAFPGKNGQPRDFLFRVDPQDDGCIVLLLSPEVPTLPDWGMWQTRPVAQTFLGYDQYRFQLRANPTVCKVNAHGRGDRVSIYDLPGVTNWFERKASESGFRLMQWEASTPRLQHFTKSGQQGMHVCTDFQGLLSVVDHPRFELAFHKGIGTAKAFGFGLMLLKPLHNTP